MSSAKSTFKRKTEIADSYFNLLDEHLIDLINGRTIKMLELKDIAKKLFVSHKYLIEIIKDDYGHHPCHFYIQKILEQANALLTNTQLTVSEIALKLTYDPSNFGKFYKKYMGITPGQYRKNIHPGKKPKSSP